MTGPFCLVPQREFKKKINKKHQPRTPTLADLTAVIGGEFGRIHGAVLDIVQGPGQSLCPQALLGKGLKPCRLEGKLALGLSHLFCDVPEESAVSSLGDTWGPPLLSSFHRPHSVP